MTFFKEYLNKQKAKARYGVSIAKLDYLVRDLQEDRSSKVDKKYWEEELKNLEEYSKYIPSAGEDLIIYQGLYEEYKKIYK